MITDTHNYIFFLIIEVFEGLKVLSPLKADILPIVSL